MAPCLGIGRDLVVWDLGREGERGAQRPERITGEESGHVRHDTVRVILSCRDGSGCQSKHTRLVGTCRPDPAVVSCLYWANSPVWWAELAHLATSTSP